MPALSDESIGISIVFALAETLSDFAFREARFSAIFGCVPA